jgi:hypothetical protein
MVKYLTKNQVAREISSWLKGNITSAQLAIWARECSEKWEDDQLELESEDLLLDILYRLRFADWLDSVPEEYLSSEPDCSLSKEEAQKLIQELDAPDTHT